jgi:predicted nuclease of predicted toxin-antitoxin system
MTMASSARLLLDEMFSPSLAAALRDLGHDVIAVAERSDLRSMTDNDIFAWAANERRWLLTENVRDFRPLLLATVQTEAKIGVLFTTSRGFPRSRKNPGPLINALDRWLRSGPPEAPITEDWLEAAESYDRG